MPIVIGLLLLALSSAGWTTPLHDAARAGDGNRIRNLLATGADINAVDQYGFTPLLLAQVSDNPRTARLLESNGARDGLGPLTERLQRYLRYLGHDPGPVDGELGPGTRAAISRYQRQIGEPVNGRIRESWVKTLHEQVHRRLQEQLRELGDYNGPISGVIGPQSREAIRTFQRRNGLAVTGEPNGDWLLRLHSARPATAATAAAATTTAAATPTTTETGRIRRLQASLTVLGHDTGGVDGVVGPATRDAIRGFQRRQNLRVDGNASTALSNRVDSALTQHVQQRLRALGFDPGPIDGVPGDNTRIAIQAFERQQGLPVTGRVSPTLAARLDAAQPRRTSSPTASRTEADSRGSAANDSALIEEIQARLNSLGYNAGPVDGQHGPRTAAAIRRFEQHMNLPRRGEPSPAILDHLQTTPLSEAQAPPAQGRPTSGGNTEVQGRLVLQHTANGELLGCSISGVQLDRSWCEPFEHHPDTSDCQAILRPDTRVLMVKCS